MRQRIARALFHKYGISVDDMKPDFKVKVDGSNKKIDIATFEPGTDHTPDNVRRLVVFQKELKLDDSALVVDFSKPGTEPADTKGGIEFHRIGFDLIRQLVEAAAPSAEATAESGSGPADESSDGALPRHGIAEVRRRRERAPAVPTLDTAAFIGSRRERSIAWEDLQSDQSAASRPPPPVRFVADEAMSSEPPYMTTRGSETSFVDTPRSCPTERYSWRIPA